MNQGGVVISALGDLMLIGEWSEVAKQGRLPTVAADLLEILGSDIVFANLETTSIGSGDLTAKEPRIVAPAEVIASTLDTLGVNVVNLANNHAFDAQLAGFEETRRHLEKQRIIYFGAGRNAAEARAHRIVEIRGVRLGWLGYVAPDTRPSHEAGEGTCGVNLLEEARVREDVRRLRSTVHHLIVSLHWGIEYCHLPSPGQTKFARSLVDEGVSLVLGHHAHVVQGIEEYRNGVIVYNLGNLTTSDHYVDSRLTIRQTPRTCSSFVFQATLTTEEIASVGVVPVRDERGQLLVGDATAARYVERANRLLDAGVSTSRWKWRRLVEDVLFRTMRKLHPRVISSIRPRHLMKFFGNVRRALSGRGPVG
ncbi:MAG: hypothetical protein GY769_22530 [bacterium]|nr:hypothetical protein [bacterium]